MCHSKVFGLTAEHYYTWLWPVLWSCGQWVLKNKQKSTQQPIMDFKLTKLIVKWGVTGSHDNWISLYWPEPELLPESELGQSTADREVGCRKVLLFVLMLIGNAVASTDQVRLVSTEGKLFQLCTGDKGSWPLIAVVEGRPLKPSFQLTCTVQ